MTTQLVLDTFSRTVANGWGSANTGQAWSTSGGVAADYAVAPGGGTHSIGAVASTRATVLAQAAADSEISFRTSTAVPAAGSYIGVAAMLRRADANNYVFAELRFNVDLSITVALVNRVAGVETTLLSVTAPVTHTPGVYYRVRFSAVGTALSAKIWVDGTAEPSTSTAYVTTGAVIAGANNPGVRTVLNAGNVNALPVTVWFSDLTVTAGVTSLGVPYPTSAEALCGSGSPSPTNWLRQMADAVQAFLLGSVDPALTAAAPYGGARRVRVSRDVFTTTGSSAVDLDTVEFNAGTPTDLGVYSKGVLLDQGRWLIFAEAVFLPSGDTTWALVGSSSTSTFVVDTSLGDTYGGGGSNVGFSGTISGPSTPFGLLIAPTFTTGPANIQYGALTAYRLADPL